ncbi:hypothetical protein [Pseudorhodoferax sp.]|uniref:hypothetical protein n=1 Tax=Pseudorhodoferax sp. TaxID=1993553 RepID=UPI002DD64416|nr:hypothetical protein [Pseudorhodoferax sp.]
MKKWTLESPGVSLLLHLGLFALVSAAVLYSERQAAPTAPPPAAVAAPALAQPTPPPAPRGQMVRHTTPALRSVPHELPVPGVLAPLRPTP